MKRSVLREKATAALNLFEAAKMGKDPHLSACPYCGDPMKPLLVVKDEANQEPEVVAIPSCFPCSYAALEEVKR